MTTPSPQPGGATGNTGMTPQQYASLAQTTQTALAQATNGAGGAPTGTQPFSTSLPAIPGFSPGIPGFGSSSASPYASITLSPTEYDDLLSSQTTSPRAGLQSLYVVLQPGQKPVTYEEAIAYITQAPRQQVMQIQQQMYAAGLLTRQPDGMADTSTVSAWIKVVLDTMRLSTSKTGAGTVSYAPIGRSVVGTLFTAADAGQYQLVEDAVQKQVLNLQASIAAPKAVSVTESDSNALREQATTAWEDALGYSPSEKELNTFVSDIHANELSSAQSNVAGVKAAQESYLNRLKSAQTQLTGLGPDGLDAFMHAWQTAAGNGRGALPGNRLTSTGLMPFGPTGRAPMPQGGNQATTTLLTGGQSGKGAGSIPSPNGNAPAPTPGRVVSIGDTLQGTYGISLAAWREAGKMKGIDGKPIIDLSKYPTPSAAPVALQQAAFTAVAQAQFNKSGSWADVAAVLSTGKPFSDLTQGENIPGTSLSAYQVALHAQQAVTGALTQVTNELNAPGPAIMEIHQQVNPAADATEMAKTSDPSQFYAHQASFLYGRLSDMLSGMPTYQTASPTGDKGPVEGGAAMAAAPSSGLA